MKPDKMQTDDDEPKWLAHAGRILREKAPQEEKPKRPTTPPPQEKTKTTALLRLRAGRGARA